MSCDVLDRRGGQFDLGLIRARCDVDRSTRATVDLDRNDDPVVRCQSRVGAAASVARAPSRRGQDETRAPR